ncbi:hypothetical protein D9M73_145980 [compost metagenome]
MHEDHVVRSGVEQFAGDLVGAEGAQACLGLVFLAHRGPHVGAYQMSAGHRFARVAEDAHALAGLGEQGGVRLIAFRAAHVQLEVEADGCLDVAVAHVVAVADPGHGLALDGATVFEERLHVGQQLARVQVIGQAVDHRYAGVGGEFGQVAVGKGTDHHGVEHARHDDRAVADRLATAQLGVAGRQEDRLATELDHAGFEGNSGAGRGLFENHPEHAVFQGLEQYAAVTQVFELNASTDHADQLFGRAIHQGEKVPCAHH